MKPLTDRQNEVVRLSAIMTDKEIARHLNISPETVDKHMRGAFTKLGVNDRKAALRALARDAPYAPDAVPGEAPSQHTRGVATAGVGEDEAHSEAVGQRLNPYSLVGLPRKPPSGSTTWLILKRAGMWMVIIAAGIAVMQAVFAFFDRLA